MTENNTLSLLLVDDDEAFVKVLSLHFMEYGYRTAIAASGREAIDLIERSGTGFDVIILDYMMPDLNGLNVLQWMLEQKCEIPVIMLTAAGSEQVAVEALKLGAYDYVRKELMDVQHLDILVRGTHERHLFRIAQAEEREKTKEAALNTEATERVRRILNGITPPLNTAFAQLAANLDSEPAALMHRLFEADRNELEGLLTSIRRDVRTVELATQALLSLFELLSAHHTEIPEIEVVRQRFEHVLETIRK